MKPLGLFNRKSAKRKISINMVSDLGNGFYAWNKNIYQSDIVRACITPKVKAIGKLVGKHIRETKGTIETEPDIYIKFLLEEPNPIMSGQKLQEKLAAQLCLNNNAFALITRDRNGMPYQIYPIPCVSVEAVYSSGELFLKFLFRNGKTYTFPYSDIIHLRQNFYDNDVFGAPLIDALEPLMDVVTTIDQGIIKAVKNSSIIRWLLKTTTASRPEDVKKVATDFVNDYLNLETESIGVAATNSAVDVTRVEPKDYVPNAAQTDRTMTRIYSLFNTNSKIVQSDWNEDGWTAYYEAEIEPAVIDLNNEYTRKIFSRKQRLTDRIIFEASNLQCASLATKLGFVDMVDRGALTPNEWREVFSLPPLPGGDKPIRRLDTAVVEAAEGGEKNSED